MSTGSEGYVIMSKAIENWSESIKASEVNLKQYLIASYPRILLAFSRLIFIDAVKERWPYHRYISCCNVCLDKDKNSVQKIKEL